MHSAMALVARGLALLWAAFWLFFFVVESWAWHTPANVMASWVALGLFFMLVAVVPWRWEVAGGLLLIVVGVLAGLAYAIWSPEGLPPVSRLITTIVFSGPPILAGVLFLVHYRCPSGLHQQRDRQAARC